MLRSVLAVEARIGLFWSGAFRFGRSVKFGYVMFWWGLV